MGRRENIGNDEKAVLYVDKWLNLNGLRRWTHCPLVQFLLHSGTEHSGMLVEELRDKCSETYISLDEVNQAEQILKSGRAVEGVRKEEIVRALTLATGKISRNLRWALRLERNMMRQMGSKQFWEGITLDDVMGGTSISTQESYVGRCTSEQSLHSYLRIYRFHFETCTPRERLDLSRKQADAWNLYGNVVVNFDLFRCDFLENAKNSCCKNLGSEKSLVALGDQATPTPVPYDFERPIAGGGLLVGNKYRPSVTPTSSMVLLEGYSEQ